MVRVNGPRTGEVLAMQIQSAKSLADIFALLLDLKETGTVVHNEERQRFAPENLAEQVYVNSWRIMSEINAHGAVWRDGQLDYSYFFDRITRTGGLRATVQKILERAINTDGSISELTLPEALPLFVIGEKNYPFHKEYALKPRRLYKVPRDKFFDHCQSFIDLFARLYELQARGEQVMSRGKSYDPQAVAQEVIKKCNPDYLGRFSLKHDHRAQEYDNILTSIPSAVRNEIVKLLMDNFVLELPPSLEKLVVGESPDNELNKLSYEPAATIMASLPADHPQSRPTTKRKNWRGIAMTCAALLASGAVGSGLYQRARRSGQLSDSVEETTPSPAEVRERELRATDPVEWHDLTTEQLAQVKRLIEQGQKYYLPLAIELIKASNAGMMMTKDGTLTDDAYVAVADLQIVNHDLVNYYNLERIRGFTVDTEVTAPGLVLGRMKGGDTPNDISDDTFAIYLPALINGTLEPWALYHEDAHGYSGGVDHIEPVASLQRDEAAFSECILKNKDYAYYTTALMLTVDYLREYHREVYQQKLRRAHSLPEVDAIHEAYRIDAGEVKRFAPSLAQLFYEHSDVLTPFGITQQEFGEAIVKTKIFEWLNEELKLQVEETKRKLQAQETDEPKRQTSKEQQRNRK